MEGLVEAVKLLLHAGADAEILDGVSERMFHNNRFRLLRQTDTESSFLVHNE
jgi:hypothetical protein